MVFRCSTATLAEATRPLVQRLFSQQHRLIQHWLGVSAGANLTTGSNNIAIGNFGVAAESNTIRIGQVQTRTFIKGISGVAIAGAAVVVNANGQLGVVASSADFKHEIRPMGEESEAILALKPVSFCYDQDIDEQSLPQFGLVAEDVEKVNPDLVLRNEEGKPTACATTW
jgi:hypothetical protein